ncbi:hypothetical protein BDU57DRAFT_525854 [Ampelomyces quisqualis]|uniref:Uncharacterized protein n=1 Tax=Ampelomyces quisqualis TaxID=50730 RepID=A0A6A5R1P0_AMPQU|nr:hypothetical protein BDU57DRAFT_525854 [Ampelomyces quisqualis]
MSSPLRHPTTLSTAISSQPGASIQNPLVSTGVRAHPNEERFYVLDRTQGFLQVIGREAQDYREIGYVVLDGYGNRVTQFDAARNTAVRRYAEVDQADAFYNQYEDIWEIIEMREAMAEAVANETIHFNFETGRWYKKKKATGTLKGILKNDGNYDPPLGSSDTVAGAESSSSVTIA